MIMFLLLILVFLFPFVVMALGNSDLLSETTYIAPRPTSVHGHPRKDPPKTIPPVEPVVLESFELGGVKTHAVTIAPAGMRVRSIQVWLPKFQGTEGNAEEQVSPKLDIFADDLSVAAPEQDLTIRLFTCRKGIYEDLLQYPIVLNRTTPQQESLQFLSYLHPNKEIQKDDVFIVQREYHNKKQFSNLVKVTMY